ncbi:hypothetical protein M1L60_14275 [Actinoplanes sp. TRM 88003]|uniref:Right handed beta helix domain-containing protein n=1 Tax=Paractinoplanes aksuensis TaxID=2939490 RepID=A0ABT1DLR0_9ACTN|nr:hypothetical protein [Actinoplanes aksuensis]MCO8271760.1 hypothetical protein [Actinoplanes aksuensis]
MRTPLRSPAVLVAVAGVLVVAVLVVIALVTPGGDSPGVATAADQPSSTGTPATAGPLPAPSGSGVPSAPPSASVSDPPASSSAPPDASPKPGSTTKAAAPKPRNGFPSASNTGLRPGTKLKAASSKVLRIQKAGTVIDRVDMRADISVEADNVTIKNSRLITAGEWAIIQREGASGLTVQDSEIRGNGKDRLQHAIFNQGGDIRILRNDMSIMSDAISTNNGLIEGNYLHDPIYFDGDHTDMIQSNSGPPSGKRLVIRNNTIINTLDQTAALALFQDFGVQHDALIENNLMAGGGYALYAGAGKLGTSYNIQVINNVFSREVYPKSGQYGPVSYWDAQGKGNVWRGNTWADTGQPVNP